MHRWNWWKVSAWFMWGLCFGMCLLGMMLFLPVVLAPIALVLIFGGAACFLIGEKRERKHLKGMTIL